MYEMMMYLWIEVSQGVGEGAFQPRGGFGTLTQVGFKLFIIFVVIASLRKDAFFYEKHKFQPSVNFYFFST